MRRLADYYRIALSLLTYGLAVGSTLVIFKVIAIRMVGRLGHLSSHYTIANDWPPCMSPECDFSVFWPAGVLARAHDYTTIYNPSAFLAFRHHILYVGAEPVNWFYPPPTLLPMMAISYISFEPAFFVWVFGLALVFVFLLRWTGLSWTVIALGSISPAALRNWELGQLGIITGGMLVAGLMMAEKAPERAGFLIGALILKPQIALLAPVALLARRNWRAIIAAALTAFLIVMFATLLLGPAAWLEYRKLGLDVSRQTLEAAIYPHSQITVGVSLFWMMRSLGIGVGGSYAIQIIGSVLAVGAAWLVWRSNLNRIDRMAITVFLSLLATPFGYTDYMVGYEIALVAVAQQRGWRLNLLDVLLWLWPALCPIVTDATGILFTPVILVVACCRVWHGASTSFSKRPLFNASLSPIR